MKKLLLLVAALSALSGMAVSGFSQLSYEPVSIDMKNFWDDTIGFGSVKPNYTRPDTIARFDGRPVKFGYDFNYLMRFLFVGDSMVVGDPTIYVNAIDTLGNKVDFSYGLRHTTVDFNSPAALDSIASLIAPPPGWEHRSLAYSYDEVISADNENITTPNDTRILMVCPTVSSHKQPAYFNSLEKLYNDTLNASNFEMLAMHIAQTEVGQIEGKIVPTSTGRRCYPMQGFNTTLSFFPCYINGNTITVGRTIHATYPAGGCFSAETNYHTFDCAQRRLLTFDDFFDPKFIPEIREVYIDRLTDELRAQGYGTINNDESVTPYTRREVIDLILFVNSFDSIEEFTDFGNVALTDRGFIFGYKVDDFSESPLETFVIPADDLSPYLRR